VRDRQRRALLLLAPLLARCALPAVSAGTFLPAGDLRRGDVHASLSMELGRVLAGPADVDAGSRTIPAGAQQWTVSTWASSDASVRWAVLDALSLEAQLKLVNPVAPFVPVPVGGALGARVRLVSRAERDSGFSLELGARVVGLGVQQSLTRSKDQRSQTDTWNYRAFGVEVPLVGTYRISPLVAVTASPFLRAYRIKAWHTVIGVDSSITTDRLPWTVVLAGGIGFSVAMDLGPVELAPGIAFEVGARPGVRQSTSFLFEPGLSVGTRF
jgi:hypothetical protein